jgi:hypothetical protein
MPDIALEMRVHRDAAPLVAKHARLVEVEPRRRPDAAYRVERRLRMQDLAAPQPHLDRLGCALPEVDARHLLAEAHRHVALLDHVGERGRDLVVEERQQRRSLVDDGDPHAERGEHRRVLDADHARADHDERPGQALQPEHVVAREDLLAVEGDVAVARGLRPAGDDDLRCADLPAPMPGGRLQLDRVGVDETRG